MKLKKITEYEFWNIVIERYKSGEFSKTAFDTLLRQRRNHLRWKGKVDLYYLAKEILGNKEFDEVFHKPLCKKIEEINDYIWQKAGYDRIPNSPLVLYAEELGYKIEGLYGRAFKFMRRKRVWLWFRGAFKTTAITVAHKIQLVLIWPDIRILLASNTLDISKKMLCEVKDHFMSNEKFRDLYYMYCPRASSTGKIDFGTTEGFTIPNRIIKRKEPTFDTAGVGTTKTGLHYDYINKDDLINEDWVNNPEQIQKSKDWDGYSRQLFDNPFFPLEDKVGTRYHFNDLYNEALNDKDAFKSLIPIKGRIIYNETNKTWDFIDGEMNFPIRFPESEWVRLQNDPTLGPSIINSQYLLNPIDPTKQKFKEEWLSYYASLPQNEVLSVYMTIDPASTQKKKSDWTVILVHAVDSIGKWYLIDGLRDRLSAPQRYSFIFGLFNKYNQPNSNFKFQKVIYEVIGGRHGDIENIKEKMLENKKFFIIEETKATHATKLDRIEQKLTGRYKAGVILWPYNLFFKSLYDGHTYDLIQLMKDEYLTFPFVKHDDILDCQSFLADVNISKGNKIAPEKEARMLPLWGEYVKMHEDKSVFLKRHPLLMYKYRDNPYLLNKIVKIQLGQWR